MYNNEDVTITVKRIDICDLLIACTVAEQCSGADKWTKLHDKLAALLFDFDQQNGII